MFTFDRKPRPSTAISPAPRPASQRPENAPPVKATVSSPGDPCEREADDVAEKVIRMTEPVLTGSMPDVIRHEFGQCEEERRGRIQTKGALSATAEAVHDAQDAVRAAEHGGEPLPSSLRSYFEPRFRHDFSRVRIHAGGEAATAASAIRARAYTMGPHIVFGSGEYAPATVEGRRLLAHELVHVVQQAADATQAAPSVQRYATQSGDGLHPLAHVATPDGVAAAQRIARPAGPAEAQAGAAPTFDRRDPAVFAALLEALDRIGELRSLGDFPLVVGGQSFQVTTEQIIRLRQTATRAIQQAAFRALVSAESDLAGYEYQHRIDEEQYIVSTIVQFVGRIQDSGPQLRAKVSEVRAALEAVRTALSTSRLTDALRALESAERASQEAHRLWREFHEGTISAGEGTVRALTFTRDASFVTLGVLAVIASGGAAATTVLGLEVGTTSAATVVSIGAPVVARIGEAGVQAGLGEQVDWTRVAVDTAVDLVLVRLGGRLSQDLFMRLGGNPAVRSLGPDLARRVFASVLTHEGTTMLRVMVDGIYRRLRGQAITWEQFGDALLDQMTDPRGLFIAVLMGAVQTAADRRHGTPREFDVRSQERTPVADIDEMRGGILYEDKNATGLYVIPPGRTRPLQTEAEWAESQIYHITVRRLTGISVRGATTTRGRQPGSTRSVPTLAEVQAARRYVFRIELDNPALRAAANAQLARLRAQFPGWTFDAIFGYSPTRQ